MRKVYTLLLAAVATIVLTNSAAAQTAPKVAFINSQRIIAEAPGAQAARQTLEREMEGYRKELGQLEEQVRKMITEYEQKQAMLSADAKRQQEEAIMQKQRDFQQRAAQLEEQAARRQGELVEPVMAKIQEAIDAIRVEGKYTMIFDVAAGSIIAADPSLDITDQVLSRLKSTANR